MLCCVPRNSERGSNVPCIQWKRFYIVQFVSFSENFVMTMSNLVYCGSMQMINHSSNESTITLIENRNFNQLMFSKKVCYK